MAKNSVSDRFVGTCIACGDYTLRGALCPGCKIEGESTTNCENPFTWRGQRSERTPSVSSQLMAREARASVVERIATHH
jgi:hypothetical protein